MVNKIMQMLVDLVFPRSHLEIYLSICSHSELMHKLTPRLQTKEFQFSPFYYKDKLIKDCIIELKERNNKSVALFFGDILAKYILLQIDIIERKKVGAKYYIVPVPQHISKTKEKGFEHTYTLSQGILSAIQKRKVKRLHSLSISGCIQKVIRTKKLHDLHGKKNRFKTIKNTMRAYITKYDAEHSYFFIIDDVYTTGATFKEVRRTLLESGALQEQMFFISIAH